VVKREERIDCEAYRRRNAVKRCVNRLQQWRGRHALREAGDQLPGDGRHRHTNDPARHMSTKTTNTPLACAVD
jgi:hypothetical protein